MRIWISITVHEGAVYQARLMVGDTCIGEAEEVQHKRDHALSAQGTAITKAFLDFQQRIGKDVEVKVGE